ncbi:MAG: hypothetical protein ACYCZF_11070 [Anaerolineae bacterium]
MSQKPACCQPVEKKGKGLVAGLLYGLIPHTFCIAFILLSVIGATAAATLLHSILLVPYLFQMMIGLSLAFATLSAVMYLRRLGYLSLAGARTKWRYLSVLYGTTIAINLLLFLVVFPAVANATPRVRAQGVPVDGQTVSAPAALPASTRQVVLEVEIPCSGHASLISGDLYLLKGVLVVNYQAPKRFVVDYDSDVVTLEQILGLEIFRSFAAKPVS